MSGAAVQVGVVGNSKAVVFLVNVLTRDACGFGIITSEGICCIGGVVYVAVFVVFLMAVVVGALAGLIIFFAVESSLMVHLLLSFLVLSLRRSSLGNVDAIVTGTIIIVVVAVSV